MDTDRDEKDPENPAVEDRAGSSRFVVFWKEKEHDQLPSVGRSDLARKQSVSQSFFVFFINFAC